MVKVVIMAVFIGCLAEVRVEVVQSNEMDTRTRENAHNLLDSITANDTQSRQKYREILQHDVVQRQQAFDGLKNNWNDKKRARFHKHHREEVTVIVKRDVPVTSLATSPEELTRSDVSEELEREYTRYPDVEKPFHGGYVAGLNAAKAILNNDRATLKNDLKIAQTDLIVKSTALGYRSTVEELEDFVFPDWLFGTKLSRKQRWIIALVLPISKYAIQIQERTQAEGISPTEAATALEKFYLKLSAKEGYKEDSPKMPQTDAEWKKFYEFVDARHEAEKVTLKISLESLKLPKKEKSTETPKGPMHRYFILLGNVNHRAQEKDVRKLLEPLKLQNLNIHMVTKYKGLPSGYVAMIFTSKTYKSLENIHYLIKRKKSFPLDRQDVCVNVYTETEGIEEVVFQNEDEESTNES